MGTNFYLLTKSKEKRDKWFVCGEYELTDIPDWGYEVHIAKTSGGWLPLFEAHEKVKSVRTIKRLYDEGEFHIFDEYGEEYDWDGFEKRVLEFSRDDADAISHIDYAGERYLRG